MKITDRTELMTRVLNVMNRAIQEHKDNFPFKQMYNASESIIGGKNLGVAVYADDPDTPHDYFTIRWQGMQLELVSHGKQDPVIAWKVSESYLNQVANEPEQYIDNPLKLDWDWMKHRLGIAVTSGGQ